jgi:hypothetical protein
MTPSARTSIWTGWDVRGGSSAQIEPDGAFAGYSPSGEVHYELLAVAGRGFRPPRFLTVADAEAPADTSGAKERDVVLRQVWSLEYRQVAETAPSASTPHAIYLLGVNPPEDASDAELEEFNDFYTNVHLPEVAERRHALRAVRFELVRILKAPYPVAPRFLATYEVDEAGASNRRHVGPPYSSGPDVWQRHTTPWRLWYRRLAASST